MENVTHLAKFYSDRIITHKQSLTKIRQQLGSIVAARFFCIFINHRSDVFVLGQHAFSCVISTFISRCFYVAIS
jgi:hypothetical protein